MPDTAIAEAPVTTPNRSVAQPPKSSKELGLVSMKDTMEKAFKEAPVVDNKAEATSIVEEVKSEGLLGKLEQPKKEEAKSKTTKEDDIRAIKAARDEAAKERDTFKAELETMRSTYIAPERHQEVEKRANDMEARLETAALERSPKFQRDFVEPKIELVDQAKALAKDIGMEEAIIDRAMNMTGKQRREFLDEAFADHSPSALAELAGLLTSIDTLDRKKASALTGWKAEREKMNDSERAAAMREAADERNAIVRAFDTQLKVVASKLPDFREVLGDDAHNTEVKMNIEYARRIVTGEASLEDQASAPYLAVAARGAIMRVESLTAEVKTLTDRLKAYENNAPQINGNGEGRTDTQDKPVGFIERSKQLWPGR